MKMALVQQILNATTKQSAQQITDQVISGAIDLDDIMRLFFSEDWRVCQRAAWPVGMLAQNHAELLVPYIREMIDCLKKPQHDAVLRNIVRVWQYMDIPEKYRGDVYDRCIGYLDDPKIPIAIRVFSMTVCSNICSYYPEMAAELIAVIDAHYMQGTAAYHSRAKKELKRLHKLNSGFSDRFLF